MSSTRNTVSALRRHTKHSPFTDSKPMGNLWLSAMQVPNEDYKKSMRHFNLRSGIERKPDYTNESLIRGSFSEIKYVPEDSSSLTSREPSFTKFKIPYQMICAKRYQDSLKAYENQLKLEINNIIDFQRSAADACYFVRCMAITSIWPPLHHMSDVNHTSKNFFELSEKEKVRLQVIMNTDII